MNKTLLLLCLFLSFRSFSQENIIDNDNIADNDFFELSLEELMNLQVTTAGKSSEKISEVPASMVIISKEEIQTYGYTSLSDILHLVKY